MSFNLEKKALWKTQCIVREVRVRTGEKSESIFILCHNPDKQGKKVRFLIALR